MKQLNKYIKESLITKHVDVLSTSGCIVNNISLEESNSIYNIFKDFCKDYKFERNIISFKITDIDFRNKFGKDLPKSKTSWGSDISNKFIKITISRPNRCKGNFNINFKKEMSYAPFEIGGKPNDTPIQNTVEVIQAIAKRLKVQL